jgi:hypothetical protein
MCLTENEVKRESVIIAVCRDGPWGCFCGYHDGEVDREPTPAEEAEMARRLGLVRMSMDEFAIAYERDHESMF